MTDHSYYGTPHAASGSEAESVRAKTSVASVTNWAGAVVSLALVAGVGVWGYKLISRDVSGVPVVIALDGPMRVAPENPGGQLADHQGLAVNEVAGVGVAAAPADRLVLAPRPAGLSEEDVALGVLAPLVQAEKERRAPIAVSLRQQAELVEPTDTPEIAEDTPLVDMDGDAMAALVAQLTADVEPLSDLAPGETPPAVTALSDIEPTSNVPPDAGLGLTRSLRPQLRPSGLRTASLEALTSEIAASVQRNETGGVREIDADTLPEGTRLVQIGAFDSPETARAEWDRLAVRFSDFLEGKSRVIQRSSSGGRVFYRLRAEGFIDLSDARRFCSEFVAANVDCIPVVTR